MKVGIAGVYEIKNKLNNKRYVGSSVNISFRLNQHRSKLNRNKHHSIVLQRAWNKYGGQQFEFNILETCEPIKDTLLFIEQKYLDLNPEYNICKIADSPLGRKWKVKDPCNMKGSNTSFKKGSIPCNARKVINIVTGEIFDTINLAAKNINMKPHTLYMKLIGTIKKNNTNMKYHA